MGDMMRLGVIDRGETAVRILNAVHGYTRGEHAIAAVLVDCEPDPQAWYGREADEVVVLDCDDGRAGVEQVAAALQGARVDGVWIGAGFDAERVELISACEQGGIVVVGPSAADIAAVGRVPTPGTETAARWLVEVDVLADDRGTVWCLGTRDVSVRDAAGTAFAEAPCSALPPETLDALCTDAVAIVTETGYHGAGVFTFAVDADGEWGLASIDVVAPPEHATTEERTGTSVLGDRLGVALGRPLAAQPPAADGVAVEARLVAEDVAPDANVAMLSFPVGTGVRIDANRRRGDLVDDADPLIAVLTAWGPDRSSALGRLHRALKRTSVVIDGATTNRAVLLTMLQHPDLVAGPVDVEWLPATLPELRVVAPSAPALLAAAVEAYEADAALAQDAFFAAAARGRPVNPADVGDGIELSYRGVSYRLTVDRTGPDSYTIEHDGTVAEVQVDRLDTFERRLACGGRRYRVVVSPTPSGVRVEVDGATHVIDRDDGQVVRAGWPALVVSVAVEPGQTVAAGEPIAVLESMKMETVVTAPSAGEVTAVAISPNSQIERGAPLIRLRSHERQLDGEPAGVDLTGYERHVDFTRKPCDRVYDPLGNYVLGFDLSDDALKKLVVQQRRLSEIAEVDDPDLLACEDGLLDIVADLGALYRPQTEIDPDDDLVQVRENTQEYLISFVQWMDAERARLPESYRERLLRALARYGVSDLDRDAELEAALTRLFRSFSRLAEISGLVVAILQRRLDHRSELASVVDADTAARLDRLARATQGRQQAIADLARDVRFHLFDEPPMLDAVTATYAEMRDRFDQIAADPHGDDVEAHYERLVWCPYPLRPELVRQWRLGDADSADSAVRRAAAVEVYLRRFYRVREISPVRHHQVGGVRFASVDYSVSADVASDHRAADVHVVVSFQPLDRLGRLATAIAEHLEDVDPDRELVVDVIASEPGEIGDVGDLAAEVQALASSAEFGRRVHRLDVTVTFEEGAAEEHLRTQTVTFAQDEAGEWFEHELLRNLHPMLAERLELWRLSNFALERRPSPEDVYLFHGTARDNPADRRLFAIAEVRELEAATDPASGAVHYPRLERTGLLAMAAMRAELARHTGRDRPVANRLVLDITAPWTLPPDDVHALSSRFEPLARRVGLEKVVLKVRLPDESAPDGLRPAVLHFEGVGSTVLVREDVAGDEPVKPLTTYRQKVLTAARFGAPYPFEIVRLLTEGRSAPGLPDDHFVELELEEGVEPDGSDDRLVPIDRPPAQNTAHVVVGLVTNHTEVVPEGMTRVAILSDPTQGLGNLAEPECRRIDAVLAYALEHALPVEWFAVSSGALIAMDSGTENMDWIARTLRRLIEYTQAGGEVNIVVTGINVGGQPYWNAEATMLTHTKGILVMSPASTMVLTGKQALDFSGAVSADDNFGIGGYDRVMGPNGQAQYWAPSFPAACELLLQHYDYTYVVPGERFPRRRPTVDAIDRDVRSSPHAELAGSPFRTVGDVFSQELNPDRKQPFDMRSVMRAVSDTDAEPLERWKDLRDGDTSIVWDTTVGGVPVCMIGLESHTVARQGFVPADGPPAWTSGTLFPHSSRKTARSINAASGNRPLVVLANLSGFDGSPESMRRRQLEFGAEIGRAITNFDGPIVFVVVSRYHGGAFVVFSKALTESMEIAAVEGSFASVIGGAPAAATVFAREVKQRTQRDERVVAVREALAAASGPEAAALRADLATVSDAVRSEKLGEVADEFDSVHTIERAQRVGSVDRIIPAVELRPYIIDALERSMPNFLPG